MTDQHIDSAIEAIRAALIGRRVIDVSRSTFDADGRELDATYPRLTLDDGSRVVLLDGEGFPPICGVERDPWPQTNRWEGDDS